MSSPEPELDDDSWQCMLSTIIDRCATVLWCSQLKIDTKFQQTTKNLAVFLHFWCNIYETKQKDLLSGCVIRIDNLGVGTLTLGHRIVTDSCTAFEEMIIAIGSHCWPRRFMARPDWPITGIGPIGSLFN